MSSDVYVIAAEYSAPTTERQPRRVFGRADKAIPSLEELMYRAGLRAMSDPRLAGYPGRIEQLLVTTMPYTEGGRVRLQDNAVRIASGLKRRLLESAGTNGLRLGFHCEDRFEIGTSDAGASLFSSAFRLLRGMKERATALVIAGQVMPGGQGAVDTVAQVLDRDEQALGLRMIPVGDMLLDAIWAKLEAAAGPGSVQDPGMLADQIVDDKLELASEYPAAHDRRGEEGGDRLMARWLRKRHLALASNGACAVILTTDPELAAMANHRGRVVRILGVGMGEDDVQVTQRRQPFLYLRSIRQALVQLRRETGTNTDFLRRSGFAVLHDAFPSIELSFLLALGYSPQEAIQRARTYWPNPYGGLTAFGHALAASGLVQIVKAFHVLTRPAAYVAQYPSTRHPNFTNGEGRVHCLTTSVGGPLTHVICTMLESLRLPPTTQGAVQAMPPPFEPEVGIRRRSAPRPPNPDDTHDVTYFEGKSEWVAQEVEAYRAAAATHCARESLMGLGVVEATSQIRLEDIEVALPQSFCQTWALGDFTWNETVHRPTSAIGKKIAAVGQAEPAQRVSQALEIAQEVIPQGTDGERQQLQRAILRHLVVPVALVSGGGEALTRVHQLCLCQKPAEVGDLVVVTASGPLPVVRPTTTAPRGLVPLWYARRWASSTLKLNTVNADLIRKLEAEPLVDNTPSMVELFNQAEAIIGEVRTTDAIPLGAVEFLEELILVPEPDRWILARALRLALASPQPVGPTGDAVVAYCEFDIVRAGDKPEDQQPRLFDTVIDAIERARSWLGPADLSYVQVADRFSVVAILKLRKPAQDDLLRMMAQAIRFTNDVYLRCMDREVELRAVTSVSSDAIMLEREGKLVGLARGGQMLVHHVMNLAPAFGRLMAGRDAAGPRHGVAVVLPSDWVQGDPTAKFQALWSQAGGPVLDPPAPGDALAQESFTLRDRQAWYQIRRRASRRPETLGTAAIPQATVPELMKRAARLVVLCYDRPLTLGISPGLLPQRPVHTRPADQIDSDLNWFWNLPDSQPFKVYVTNAVELLAPTHPEESATLQKALDQLLSLRP